MNYFVKIGLEIHIELKTKTKMFCHCLNDPEERHPNLNICEVCTGQPGVLPTINEEAVRKVIKTGLALRCEISHYSQFDRKNYFYPDLPKGYQISQFYFPLCKNGFLEIEKEDNPKKVRIREIHLEEDTARLIHEENFCLVDFNRAGIPLMELTTYPDLNSPKEARQFAEKLHLLMHYLDISDADMEKGEMRVEANVSLSPKEDEFGTKVEIKNLNSFRSVEQALEYEIKRQKEILERGEKVSQETRGWNEKERVTVLQREKEMAHDYRYFPEPDLPPLIINEEEIRKVRLQIPELPWEKEKRFKEEYGLDEKSIKFFVYYKELSEFYEKVMSELRAWVREIEKKRKVEKEEFYKLSRLCSNYIISDLQGLLKKASISDEDFLITPENFAELISLVYEGKISSKIAKMVLEEMFATGEDPSNIIYKKGLIQLTDEKEIKKIVEEVISENQKAVEDYKKGKKGALQFLIGKVMQKTKGKANPQLVREYLSQFLS